jgi:hypothetical protein
MFLPSSDSFPAIPCYMTYDIFPKFVLQAETDVTKMEPVQRNPTAVERQDPTEQRHLALLAHAV